MQADLPSCPYKRNKEMLDTIAPMPRYEGYRYSGFESIGDIPQHWDLLANRNIFTLKKGQVGKNADQYDLLSLTLKGVIKRDIENPEGKFPAEFDTYQPIKPGDFIFCFFDVEETPRAVGISPFSGMITGAYTVFEASPEINHEYLHYLYYLLDKHKMLRPLYRGLRNTIPKENFYAFRSILPPREEQDRIVVFLDRKTAQIDQAIAIKQQQIALLKERKQIIIQNAVTKGINPDAPMKASGVDWIGDIPAHWEVRKLKYILSLQSVKINSKESNLRYVGMESIEAQTGNLQVDVAEAEAEGITNYFRKGDILFGKLRPYLKKVHLAKTEGICSTELLVYSSESCDGSFYVCFLISDRFINVVNASTYGSKMPRANSEYIGNLKIVMPPKKEQIEIASHIEALSSQAEQSVNLYQAQIQKLQEYKATLINSAVTGKIKIS